MLGKLFGSTTNAPVAGIPVTTKGTKGFLAWLALNQGPIYDAALPKLKALAAQSAAQAVAKPSFQGLGQFEDDSGDVSVDTSGSTPDLSASIDDTVIQAPTAASSLMAPTVTFPPDSPVTAATTTATPTATASAIASIIGSVTGAAVAVNNMNNQNTVLQTQLARAQAGLPPLNVSPSLLGLPAGTSTTITGSLSPTFMLFLLGGLALVVFGGRKKSA
jgi:hypothetical protein